MLQGGSILDLLEPMEQFIRRHRLLVPRETVLVAVSGGPDSLALLHLLTRLRTPWQLTLHVAHVDHGLRPEAVEDAAFVESIGRAWDVPVTVKTVDVRGERQPGESVQQAARRLRYRALAEVARTVDARRIALGHHADDQAETVLMRLLRGAGPTGLAGMRPRRGPYIRPLLGVTRADVEAYCRRFGLEPRRDPSNLSPQYLRSRIRHHLLPILEQEYNPNIRTVLSRTAALLREEDDLVEALARRAHRRLQDGRGPTDLPVDGLARLPVAIARRVVRHMLHAAGVNLGHVTADHVAAILALLPSREAAAGTTPTDRPTSIDAPTSMDAPTPIEVHGRLEPGATGKPEVRAGTVTVPGGVRVRCADGRLVVEGLVRRPTPDVAAGGARGGGQAGFQKELAVPGETRLSQVGLVIDAEVLEPPESRALVADPRSAGGHDRAVLDWDRVVPPLVVRSWRPGDRMRPLGLAGTKKLQDIFVDAKVPAAERRLVPVVADQEGILWVVGLRVDARGAVGPRTTRVLRLRVKPVPP